MMLGAASTGTAISALSGVEATNATIAFFGGGSLATGGLGIAGGTPVRGGVVPAPALAVLGTVMCAKGSANKNKAYANLSQAQDFAAEMDVATDMCEGITKRARMFTTALRKMDGVFTPLVMGLGDTIRTKGTDFQSFDQQERQNVAACCAMAQAMKALLDTPILDEEGNLTEKSATALQQTGLALEQVTAKNRAMQGAGVPLVIESIAPIKFDVARN